MIRKRGHDQVINHLGRTIGRDLRVIPQPGEPLIDRCPVRVIKRPASSWFPEHTATRVRWASSLRGVWDNLPSFQRVLDYGILGGKVNLKRHVVRKNGEQHLYYSLSETIRVRVCRGKDQAPARRGEHARFGPPAPPC